MSPQQRDREHKSASESSMSVCSWLPASRRWTCLIAAALLANAVLLCASMLRPADVVRSGGVSHMRAISVSVAVEGGSLGGAPDLHANDTVHSAYQSLRVEQSQQDASSSVGSDQYGAFDHLPVLQGVAVKPRRAIVTFVQNDAYVAGAVTLAYTLRKHANALPLVLLTLDGASETGLSAAAVDLLTRAGWQVRPVKDVRPFKKTSPQFRHQYTKLRLFDLADDYDLLLYLDADIMVIGRQEAALDYFAPDGVAPHPVGAVGGFYDRSLLNGGVLALTPSHTLFREMMHAAREGTVKWQARFAEQAFLNAFLKKQHGWTPLPTGCNLLTVDYEKNPDWFNTHFRNATAIHFVGGTANKVMVNRIVFSADGSRVVSTSHGRRSRARGVLDAMWIDAWTEARHILGLPVGHAPGVPSGRMLEAGTLPAPPGRPHVAKQRQRP